MRNGVFLRVGAWAALLAVVAGAFGAHALGTRIDAGAMATFRTAVLYHFLHALALFVIGTWQVPPAIQEPVRRSAWLLTAGALLFSGSLYLLALTGIRWLGAITPLGGVAFLIGWGCLAWSALRA